MAFFGSSRKCSPDSGRIVSYERYIFGGSTTCSLKIMFGGIEQSFGQYNLGKAGELSEFGKAFIEKLCDVLGVSGEEEINGLIEKEPEVAVYHRFDAPIFAIGKGEKWFVPNELLKDCSR